jgi:hypothetical protein
MRHVLVSRLVVAITIVLVAACLIFAAVQS